MKKYFSFVPILGILVFSMFMFTLTSKDDFDPSGPPCENQDGQFRTLNINFNDAEFPVPYRKSIHEFFIPTPDLRFGNVPGAPTLVNAFDITTNELANNYYAAITITSPQCENWEWQRVFDGFSNGDMQVVIPEEGFDARVEIKYYERTDQNGYTDFNEGLNNNCGQNRPSRILYTSSELVFDGFWDNNSTKVFTMIPSGQIDTFSCFDGTGVDLGPKSVEMADYNSVNEFIDINDLNPKPN